MLFRSLTATTAPGTTTAAAPSPEVFLTPAAHAFDVFRISPWQPFVMRMVSLILPYRSCSITHLTSHLLDYFSVDTTTHDSSYSSITQHLPYHTLFLLRASMHPTIRRRRSYDLASRRGTPSSFFGRGAENARCTLRLTFSLTYRIHYRPPGVQERFRRS